MVYININFKWITKSLNKSKRTKIITSIFSDHNSMKSENNYRKKIEGEKKNVKIKQSMLLKTNWVN